MNLTKELNRPSEGPSFGNEVHKGEVFWQKRPQGFGKVICWSLSWGWGGWSLRGPKARANAMRIAPCNTSEVVILDRLRLRSPPSPGIPKALLFPDLVHKLYNKGKQGARARHNAELPPFIPIVLCPGRPVISVPENGLPEMPCVPLKTRN